MLPRTLAVLVVVALLYAPVFAQEDEEPEIQAASDKEVRHEFKVFDRDFDTEDIDFKLDAVIRLSKCIHKKVTDRLLAILFKAEDPYLRAEAAKGLRNQVLYGSTIGKKTMRVLTDDDTDPKVLAELVLTLGALPYKRAWEDLIDLVAHDDDKVVINVFFVLGEWKELRACLELQGFWDAYPTEGSWSTGTVRVDTGTSGNADARAAKAKWQAKYGNRRKQRARPECVKALKVAIQKMTGTEIATPDDFRTWRSDNKELIRAAKRQR